MSQLELAAVVTHGVTHRLQFYAGYCFGWRTAWQALSRWVSACVVTPRYIERACADVDPAIPLVIDNGAFAAWRDDRDLTLLEQVAELERAIEHATPERVKFVIWPDVVGNPRLTWRRINDTFRCFDHRRVAAMVPVQEGMNPLEQAQLAAYREGGAVFIGGRTRAWKLATARAIRARFPDLHIHVGRLSSAGHLHSACMAGVTSFDTTTYMQGRGTNQRTDYRPRLRLYAQRRRVLTPSERDHVTYYE